MRRALCAAPRPGRHELLLFIDRHFLPRLLQPLLAPVLERVKRGDEEAKHQKQVDEQTDAGEEAEVLDAGDWDGGGGAEREDVRGACEHDGGASVRHRPLDTLFERQLAWCVVKCVHKEEYPVQPNPKHQKEYKLCGERGWDLEHGANADPGKGRRLDVRNPSHAELDARYPVVGEWPAKSKFGITPPAPYSA